MVVKGAKDRRFIHTVRRYELKTAWKRIRFQQGQLERYKEGLERSGAYMAFIRLMFNFFNIPDRIAYLPHVESSFNINAYSRVGATGMWQFMQRLPVDSGGWCVCFSMSAPMSWHCTHALSPRMPGLS